MKTSARILLLEDDEESVFLISRLLQRIGYEENNIVACYSLEELNNTTEDDFEVILTDLTLPDSTFDQTFERVHAVFPYAPIIILTGKDERDFAQAMIQQGAQDYLIKGTFGQELLEKSIRYSIERNKIRRELEKSRADYTRVFEDNPHPIIIFNRHTYQVLAVNSAAIHQYGYSRQEWLARYMDMIRPEEDRQPFRDILHTLTDKYMDAGTWRHIYHDGTIVHVQIYSHKTKFHNTDAIVTMAINIDEKVRTKERLRERNKEITDILDSISDGFYTVNREWVITYVNAAFEEMFRKKKEQVTGQSLWECFPLFKDSPLHDEVRRVMEEGNVYQTILQSVTIGKWLSVSVYPVKDGVAIYLQNINEELQLKQKLMNNDKALRAIINNTEDVIWSIDRKLRVIEANQPFWDTLRQRTGKEYAELEQQDLDPQLFTEWEGLFERAFKGERFSTIWTEETVAGTTFAEISFNPIYDNDNNISAISCFSRNITAERTYLNRIEQQNRQLKEIAWLQSHKVRSHVATILGLSQFINKNIVADPDLNKVLVGIQDAARQLDVVIRDINGLTRSVDG